MKKILTLLVWVVLSMMATSANAILISFTPSSQTRILGDNAGVDIVVSDLFAANEIISAFDLDVTYDPFVLGTPTVIFNHLRFGGIADTLSSANMLPGRVDFALISFLLDSDLIALQDDSLILASLIFPTVSIGSSALDFDFSDVSNFLVGKNGLPLNITADSGSVLVNPRTTAVSEPGSLSLTLVGLLAVVPFLRMMRKRLAR